MEHHTYDHLRQQLLAEKTELEVKAKETNNFHLESSMRDSDGELSLHDNHPADSATTMYEREKDLSLLEHYRLHLEDIEQALKRMEEGTYGICQKCGEPIPLERLEAIPTATYCITHESKSSDFHDPPVEEEVLTGFGQFDFDGRDNETEFDAEDSWQSVARFNERENIAETDYDEDEARGYVEPIDGFIITDGDGLTAEESDFEYNELYRKYMGSGEGYGLIWRDEIFTSDQMEEDNG
ncbi:TraR/DksA C4-type zinc finger protein [Bacillus horti]|uniref:YteA family regulatory protein n=1 Tax=Caldalkalibacillus horti TaxID=77523 RepID=A0ABT9VUS2_9BACI|nr:TraR/DksA C4-type zinc finger protein [Bacillus horti]MDQ0164629.1 YteA family regulatory protein [Bacillus horti]